MTTATQLLASFGLFSLLVHVPLLVAFALQARRTPLSHVRICADVGQQAGLIMREGLTPVVLPGESLSFAARDALSGDELRCRSLLSELAEHADELTVRALRVGRGEQS